jgi:hypothetical protein
MREYGVRMREYGVRMREYGVRMREYGVRMREYGLRGGCVSRGGGASLRRAVTDRIARERCVCTHGCDLTVNTLFSPATPPRIAGRVALTVLRGGR